MSAGNTTLGQPPSAATELIMNGGTLRCTRSGSTTTDRGAAFNSFSNIVITPSGGTLVATGGMAGFAGGVGLLKKVGPGTPALSGAGDNAKLHVLVTA